MAVGEIEKLTDSSIIVCDDCFILNFHGATEAVH